MKRWCIAVSEHNEFFGQYKPSSAFVNIPDFEIEHGGGS
jgi:hypothetical protein